MKSITYVCEECGAKTAVGEGAPIPDCCGLPMKNEALPGCTTAETAEMARLTKTDEPCDDGTGNKKS